jgi:hypothetical protein
MWAATGQPEICCKSGVPPREPDCGIAREKELVWVSQVTRRDLGTRIQTKGGAHTYDPPIVRADY